MKDYNNYFGVYIRVPSFWETTTWSCEHLGGLVFRGLAQDLHVLFCFLCFANLRKGLQGQA